MGRREFLIGERGGCQLLDVAKYLIHTLVASDSKGYLLLQVSPGIDIGLNGGKKARRVRSNECAVLKKNSIDRYGHALIFLQVCRHSVIDRRQMLLLSCAPKVIQRSRIRGAARITRNTGAVVSSERTSQRHKHSRIWLYCKSAVQGRMFRS